MLEYGLVLVVDELESRLNPLILREIVSLFHSEGKRSPKAQLIFAVHNTNLLDRSLFRRDQVWIAERSPKGVTNLHSLKEYRTRKDASFEKDYLAGKYGGVPFPRDLDFLEEK